MQHPIDQSVLTRLSRWVFIATVVGLVATILPIVSRDLMQHFQSTEERFLSRGKPELPETSDRVRRAIDIIAEPGWVQDKEKVEQLNRLYPGSMED